MRLRQLVIKGFKSFPDRTSLAFPLEGISAIVGPNGCGKSNILDAIRWVLGEQSPKMLRAKNMEDVIYSGPNGRQVGYAEVQMVLELASGQDKKKVEVARRLYKSGEAKYLIDGKAVRLKDILYLFMDTGTGTRAYALVDQGQVARFVEMGPNDRKVLIEEAAGISKYKQKRRETEARLQKTIENIERLTDILTEIRREHARTEKEAETAREYIALEEELNKQKKALYAKLFSELIEKKRLLIDEKNSLLKDLSSIKRALKEKKEEAQEIDQEITDNEAKYEGLLEVESDLFEAIERIELTVSKKRRRAQELRQEYREKALRKGDLESRLQGLRKKKAALEMELEAKVKALGLLKEEYEKEEGQYKKIYKIIEGLKKTVDSTKDQIVDAKSNLARVEGEEKSIVIRRDDYLRRREGIREKLKKLDEKGSELIQRLESERIRAKGLEQAIFEQKNDIDQLTHELEALKEEEGLRRRIFKEISSKLDSTNHRLEAIKEIIDKGLDLSDQTRSALNVLEKKGITHHGLLVDHLDIEPGWEQIVEYSLGRDFLQAIVLAAHNDLEAVLEPLDKEGASGPIWFISSSSQVISGDKVEGQTLPIPVPIKCPEYIYPHIKGRMEPFLKNDFKLAAKDKIIGEDCVLFLGNNAQKKESGLIQRRNELKMLLALREELLEQHREAKKALDQTLSTISSKKAQLDESLNRLNSQKKELSVVKNNLSKIEHELNTIKDQQEALDLEAQSILVDIEELENESAKLKVHKDALQERLAQLETRLADNLSNLKKEEERARRFQAKVSRLKSDIVREETKREELRRNIHSLKGTITRLVEESKAIQQLESRLKESLEKSESGLGELQQELESLRKRLEDVREEKEEVYELLRSKREEYSGFSSEIEGLEVRQKDLVEKIHKKELSLSSIEQKIDALKEETQEVFSQDLEVVWEGWAGLSQMGTGELKKKIKQIRQAMNGLGPVNLGALKRLEELEERLTFLNSQMDDLKRSHEDLKQAISKIDTRCKTRLKEALDGINRELSRVFPLLFDGGSARLELTKEGEDILDKGIEFLVQLPGKAVKSLQLLSGGEKALSALSLIFSIFFLKPAPFCVLDEVDAALDEANCVRFARLLKEIAKKCQVILITHNPRVMEAADRLFGVTMEERGISKLVSVNLQ